jgi:hypothetical protein
MMVWLPPTWSHASSREVFVRQDHSADISQQSNRADPASRGRPATRSRKPRAPWNVATVLPVHLPNARQYVSEHDVELWYLAERIAVLKGKQ